MTTVKDFREFLGTLPQDAEVEVLRTKDVCRFGEGYTSVGFEPFDPARDVEVTDFRGNKFVKPGHPYFGRTIVSIGERG